MFGNGYSARATLLRRRWDAGYDVAILGTGFGGLGMALRLKEQGDVDFVILEKAASVGGTWRDNTYPGAACDVRSHLYWLSFTEPPEWSRTYCDQPEILRNMERLADRSGLKPSIRFDTEVIDATWDDATVVMGCVRPGRHGSHELRTGKVLGAAPHDMSVTRAQAAHRLSGPSARRHRRPAVEVTLHVAAVRDPGASSSRGSN